MNGLEHAAKNWDYLRQQLEDLSDRLILPEPEPDSEPSWFGFLITVRPEVGLSRNAVTRYLEEHNIQTRLLFSGNLTLHPCFDQIRGTDAYRVSGPLDVTNRIMENTFWIGVYPGMTKEKLDAMVQALKEACA